MKAGELAYQQNDEVKAQIWYAQAEPTYKNWQNESEAATQQQLLLLEYALTVMRQAHHNKMAEQVCTCQTGHQRLAFRHLS